MPLSILDLPVDIGENSLLYSDTERLQEILTILIQFLRESQYSPEEWVDLLQHNNCEIFNTLAGSITQLVEKEENIIIERKTKSGQEEQEQEQEQEEENKEKEWSTLPLGLISQILVMFASLKPKVFIKILTKHAFFPILQSLQRHKYLTMQDSCNRLQLLIFITLSNLHVEIEIECLTVLSQLLKSQYEPVTHLASLCMIYFVSRARRVYVKQYLQHLQTTLDSEEFRHFTEYYFQLINECDYNNQKDDSLWLLMTFNSNVFKWQLNDFYFTSDIKILIDVYMRSFRNCDPTSKSLYICLDGMYNILNWPGYTDPNICNQYQNSEMQKELKELKVNVVDSKEMIEKEEKSKEKEELNTGTFQVLEWIDIIITKIDTIISMLQQIEAGTFHYKLLKDDDIILPVDISEYALSTKDMGLLQHDWFEFLHYLSESRHSREDWLNLLKEDNYDWFIKMCRHTERLAKWELSKFNQTTTTIEEILDTEALDKDMMLPLSTIAQLLNMFCPLDPATLLPLIREYAFENIMKTIVHHASIDHKDAATRLQLLAYVTANDPNLKLEDEWFRLLCSAFASEFERVMNNAGLCLIYFISKLDLQGEKQLQLEYLKKLTQTLPSDVFRHFSQFYIETCNNCDWEQDSTHLCIHFGQCILIHELDDFFFTSDMKVLIDIYERCLHNNNPSSKGMLWCLDAVQTTLQWSGYAKILQHYHLDEIKEEVHKLLAVAKEGNLHELMQKTTQVLEVAGSNSTA